MFNADTGASKTVISKRVYEKMEARERPRLVKSSKLKGAGGAPIKESGKAVFGLKLGPLKIVHEAIVADIEDDALIGFDVLRGSEKGPADILLSKGAIVIDGVEIPCMQIGGMQKARKVTVAEDFKIPGNSEAVIDVYVERTEADDVDPESRFIVAPTENFGERYQLLMASSLIDVNKAPTSKVRILNPFPTETTIRQDAVIGVAERIESIVSVLQEEEYEEEEENICRIRRLQTGPGSKEAIVEIDQASGDEVPEHLRELFQNSTKGKPELEKRIVAGLLVKFQNTFSRDEWDLGLTDLAEHPINTGDAAPVKQRPRRVPLAYADEEKKAVEDMLKKGVIQKSTSPWAQPIVLIKKKSGAIRPCIDYRRVNALVKPDGFPLPRVQDCLDAVAGSSLFSSFDLTSGYYQIPLKKEDIPKSAFCCKYGHYEMTRMPFGLNNASGTFQRTMELALQGLQWVTCLVYIDDIIVYGEDFKQHARRVSQVLERISNAGLKLKPEKCRMLQTEVVFLGHVVSEDGVRPDPTNISKIIEWPVPCNSKQVKQCVATGSYYRRFVKDYAKLSRPLINLTKKGVEFNWTTACEKAFNEIKRILVSPEVMGYPMNEGGQFFLDVDASGEGIGGVLQQMQLGRERVIAYGSRTMNKAEKNYCITEKELLAVVFFVQYYRQYLLGRRFTVRTDHQALVWLFSLKEPNGKIARWIEILAPYDFGIEYRPGHKQGHCDALSRCPTPKDCTCSEVDMSEPLKCGPCKKCRRRAEMMVLVWPYKTKELSPPEVEVQLDYKEPKSEISMTVRGVQQGSGSCVPIPGPSTMPDSPPDDVRWRKSNWLLAKPPEELAKLQLEDPDIAAILKAKRENQKPSSDQIATQSPAVRHYWLMWDSLKLRSDVLFRTFTKANGIDTYEQLVLPRSLKQDVLYQMHNSVTAGHMGVKKTKEKILTDFYWFKMKPDIALYIKRCDTCAADKKPQKRPKAPMGSLRTGAPGDVLAVDFLGPFPRTPRNNRYILVLTDHFSKYVEVVAVPNQSAEECSTRVADVIARWGAPLAIHSDQGGVFESKMFGELCRLFGVRKTRTSPRNPQGNGQTERFNRTLLKMIKAFLADEQEDWDLHLSCLAGAYNATPHESTKMTPNLLTMGREVRLPANVVYGHKEVMYDDVPSKAEFVANVQEKMWHAQELARRYLGCSSKRSKEMYDAKLSFHPYKVGDIVWFLQESRKVGVCPKLEKTYDGPFVIKQKMSDLNFLLQMDANGQERLVHHNKLKLYEGQCPPKWVSRVSKSLTKSCKRGN